MNDYRAMALFVHVIERGSFTAAAKHLGQPLSTVSRRIAELEQNLGIRLLERSTRSVRLTNLGQEYFELCKRGIQEFENANLLVQNQKTDLSGLLCISVPTDLVEPYFLPVSVKFQEIYENVRIAIHSTERTVDLVHENIDIAFRIGSLKDSRLSVRKIATYNNLLIASPEYLKNNPEIRNPSDLENHPIIGFGSTGKPCVWKMTQSSKNRKTQTITVKPVPKISMNDFPAICAAVALDQGIASVPSIICSKKIQEGKLQVVLPDWSFPSKTISALNLGPRNMSQIVRLFMDYCTAHLPTIFNEKQMEHTLRK